MLNASTRRIAWVFADFELSLKIFTCFIPGEATHATHPATVVGALHEGERAALQVHDVNGSPSIPPTLSAPLAPERGISEKRTRPLYIPDPHPRWPVP